MAEKITAGPPVEALGVHDPSQHHHEEGHDYNFYAYMAEVEVDRDTGHVSVEDVVAVVDVGTVINPVAHQGQLDGGFIYGFGGTMMEDLVIEDGHVTTLSLGEYKMPTQMDVPRFRTILLPPADGPGPFGAKSAGETTNTGVAGAIANAVSAAVGVHITNVPISAERVYEALRANGG